MDASPSAEAEAVADAEKLLPQVLYESVDLEVSLEEEEVKGCATLWLGFDTDVRAGSQFALHCKAPVREVQLNGRKIVFEQRDPFQLLRYGDADTCARATRSADTAFRCATTAAAEGELRVTIPEGSLGALKASSALPEDSPADVAEAHAQLDALLLSVNTTGVGGADSAQLMQLSNGDFGTGFRSLLQLRILYTVGGSARAPAGGGGVRWHRPAAVEAQLQRQRLQGQAAGVGRIRGAVCVHTLGGGGSSGSVADVDGARGWMPCLDVPEQRCLWDLTVRAPAACAVVSSGKRVSRIGTTAPLGATSNTSSSLAVAATPWAVTRFASAVCLPALAVGFFVGSVESYRMGLYRTHGRVMVATGIADTVDSERRNVSKKAHVVPTVVNSRLTVPCLQRPRSGSQSSDHSDGTGEHHQQVHAKRARRGSWGSAPRTAAESTGAWGSSSYSSLTPSSQSRHVGTPSDPGAGLYMAQPPPQRQGSEHKRPRSAGQCAWRTRDRGRRVQHPLQKVRCFGRAQNATRQRRHVAVPERVQSNVLQTRSGSFRSDGGTGRWSKRVWDVAGCRDVWGGRGHWGEPSEKAPASKQLAGLSPQRTKCSSTGPGPGRFRAAL